MKEGFFSFKELVSTNLLALFVGRGDNFEVVCDLYEVYMCVCVCVCVCVSERVSEGVSGGK